MEQHFLLHLQDKQTKLTREFESRTLKMGCKERRLVTQFMDRIPNDLFKVYFRWRSLEIFNIVALRMKKGKKFQFFFDFSESFFT